MCSVDHRPAGSAGNLSLGLQGIARALERGTFPLQALWMQPGSAALCAVPAGSHSCVSWQRHLCAQTSHPREERFRCCQSSLKSTLGNFFSTS